MAKQNKRPQAVTLGGKTYNLQKTIGALTATSHRCGLKLVDPSELHEAISGGGVQLMVQLMGSYFYECHRSWCLLNAQAPPAFEEFSQALELEDQDRLQELAATFGQLLGN